VTLFAQLVVLLPFLFGVMGLTVDGGQMLIARREVQSVADAAARAGAGELAVRAVRGGSSGAPPLDVAQAQAAAQHYVDIQGSGLQASVAARPDQVVVLVTSRPVQFLFLRILGVTGARVQATAVASPRTGVVAPD
jgi:Flp pilus assembly protein TadG